LISELYNRTDVLKDDFMNKCIVPTLSRSEARENITVDIEAWRNFAQRITKNPFVKAFLLERDGNKCSWCKKELQEKKIIHHTSYDHYCSYHVVLRIASPSEHNPFKTRLAPDCKKCKAENEDRFLACVSKLVLVHNMCNKKVSEIRIR
jgi:hypothetical protein